ncbi:GntR family transcriptional regulator [Actinoplanes sp. HUAS TT8]|uniref:GntR family transcriptional regulator n=1 Tax=Actinoplanes sp. HUAS TT8 TaxID=3447453 RepID=UPI003F52836B
MTAEPAIRLEPGSAVPPYEQVRHQIADLIRHGLLPAGKKLPPVRQLAADLGVANGTVARAYQELEASGLVTTRRAAGTRVAAVTTLTPEARAASLLERAQEYVLAARQLGADDPELRAALDAALAGPAGAAVTLVPEPGSG